MSSLLAGQIDLGLGHTGIFAWWEDARERPEGIPYALMERHGRCKLFLPWACPDPLVKVLTLVTLNPLSLLPTITCPTCGSVGSIREGSWIPSLGTPNHPLFG